MNRSVTAGFLLLAACGLDTVGDPDRIAHSASRQQQELRRPIDDDGIIIGNALSTRSLLFSTLLTSQAGNAALTHNPLNTNSFANVVVLKNALKDPASLEVLGYLVGCALPATSVVTVAPAGSLPKPIQGQAGLCPAWETLPAGAVVSASCQQLVSACIISRNNALGLHVPLSLRGDDTVGGATLQVGVHFSAFDFREGTQSVNSLKDCTTVTYGVARDCGFKAGQVHSCFPGSWVTIAAGAPPSDACTTGTVLGAVTSGDMVLRACKGVAGCDQGMGMLDQSEGYECSNYAYKPTLSFECPGDGLYNVMAAPYVSSSYGSVALGELGSALATEAAAFDIREGAFYGNVFDPASLNYEVTFSGGVQTITPSPGTGKPTVFQSMFACADEGWMDGTYFGTPDRREGGLCALGNCAANYTGTCRNPSGAQCYADTSGDREFRQCRGAGTTWTLGLTSFLRNSCDLTPGNPAICARYPN